MIRRLINTPNRLWHLMMDATKELCMRLVLTFILFTCYLFFSMIIYAAMRQILVPQKTHALPVHLYFNPQCADGSFLFNQPHKSNSDVQINQQHKMCPYPSADFSLASGDRLLSPGHTYTVAVELEMPESQQNADIGMFMVNLTLYSKSGKIIGTSIRPAILHFKSWLLQTLSTIFYSFPLVLGLVEEKQHVTVEMYDNYQESYFTDGSIYATVTIMTYKIQLYSVSLSFDANFSGLAYYLYHWPISMAVIIITGIFFSITAVTLLMWLRRVMNGMNQFRYNRRQRMNLRGPVGLDPIPEEEEEQQRRREREEGQDEHVEDLSTSDGSTTGINDTTDNMSTISSATEIGTSDVSDIEIHTDDQQDISPLNEGVRQRTAITPQ